MLSTDCVQHAYTFFFMFTDDYLDVARRFLRAAAYPEKQSYPFATSLRVLETWKNDLLKKLDEAGITEDLLTEEMLWMDTEWSRMCLRALHIFESRTFQKTLPRVIEAGFARQRYIKRDGTGQRVSGADGHPLVYVTYQDARRDKAHPGEIIHQVLFESEAVNAAIAGLTKPPTPDDNGSGGGKTPKTEKGDAHSQGDNLALQMPPTKETRTARGGNLVTGETSAGSISPPLAFLPGIRANCSQNSHSDASISSQKCEGGAQNSEEPRENAENPGKNAQDPSQKCANVSQKDEDPVRKSASNKNLSNKIQQESLVESITNACGAGVDLFSQFDFFREYDQRAILDLATLIMPLPETYKSEERKQKALLDTEKAAVEVAGIAFLRERGLAHTARLFCYLKDPTSPCSWRKEIHKDNPGMQVRLWHLTKRVAQLASREMERLDWWPAGLSQTVSETSPADELVVIDLAELAGVMPESRVGMDRETALDLIAYVRSCLPPEEFPGVFVDYGSVSRWQRHRGYYVEFWYADGQMIRLYSLADFELVAANAEALGSPDFVPRLAEALRATQIA